MFDGADTVILFEELAYQDVLPVLWRNLPSPVDSAVIANYSERNLRVLQACAAIEEHGSTEKPDENAPHAADILRLDFKINLLLDLVGQILITNRPRPHAVPVRFNALGAQWKGSAPLPEAGATGVAEIYLRDCVAEPLRMIGRVTNVTPDGHIKAKFTPPGETIADLIEKLAFRRHRRKIAESRQPRR
jgi:Atypical PilZ domain, cyclic di-GMP receptor